MSEIRELRVVLKPDKNVLRLLNGNRKKVRGRPRKTKLPIMFKGTEDIEGEKTDNVVENKEVIAINRFVPKKRTRAAMKAVPDLFPPEVVMLPEKRRKRRRLVRPEDAVYNTEVEIKKELFGNCKEISEEMDDEEIPLFKRRSLNPESITGQMSLEKTSLQQETPAERTGNNPQEIPMNGNLVSETDEDVIVAHYSSIYIDSQTSTSTQMHRNRSDDLITLKNPFATVLDKSVEKGEKQESFEDLLDSSKSSSRGSSPVLSEDNQNIHEIYQNIETKERTAKDKPRVEVLSDTFDSKLPEWREAVYSLMKQVQDYKIQEEVENNYQKKVEEELFEKRVLNNLHEIKLAVQELRGRGKMVEKATQTVEFLPLEDNSFFKNMDPMIVLDSVGSTPDKQNSVFQRLGGRDQEILDNDTSSGGKKLTELTKNPAPAALSFIDFQRDMIERENRRCNILMKGLTLSSRNMVDGVNNFIQRKMKVDAGVSRVMMLGEKLVVTVGSAGIKKWIIRKSGMLEHSGVVVDNDFTGREQKVQTWLESEAQRRSRGSRLLQVAYQKIKIDGCWWYWNELEGRLTRNEFRTDVIAM